jgi:16S rRNA (guanine966-N2)-methyltransferase
VRVAGGELRGRRLKAPRGQRPTTERVREAVFSILGDIGGARVLDLFCGSGALAIEALSRGATRAVLIDTDPRTARANVEALGLGERAETVRADACRWLDRRAGEAFDLILCDPPYGLDDRSRDLLSSLVPRALAPEGRVVMESSPARPLDLELPLARERAYGDTLIRVYAGEEAE